MKLLYIHGFLSNGNARKASVLKKYFGADSVVAPSLPINPDDVICIISKIFEAEDSPGFIIGSSLGGFYANFFHKKLSIPCLLVNPSLKPHISLSVKFGVGVHTNPDTGIQVNLKTKHIDSFRDIFQQTQQLTEKPDLLNLLICKDDELLPYKQTLDYFKAYNKLILLENGGHKMENFEEQIPVIKELIDEYN